MRIKNNIHGEISCSQGGEYENECFQACYDVQCCRSVSTFQRCLWPHQFSEDGDSRHLWNVGKLLPDYKVHHSRRQPSYYHMNL
jgi:hypothetical protein